MKKRANPSKAPAGKTNGKEASRNKGSAKKKASKLPVGITIGFFAVIIVLLAFSASGILRIFGPEVSPFPTSEASISTSSEDLPTSSPIPTDLSTSAVLMATGDIILHQTVIDGGLQAEGGYNYDYLFEYAKPHFLTSDIVVVNYEGALNGSPYSGYPFFNAPDEIAKSIKNAGIDLVTTANNHAIDKGIEGLKRTPLVFNTEGVDVIGTRAAPEDPKFIMRNLNGIKVAFTSYTYETYGTETSRGINGNPLPEEAIPLLDSFTFNSQLARFELDRAGMVERIGAMNEAGAECIVFVMHWGEEYISTSNNDQKSLAQFLSDNGVDIIFGHHPHVIQEISILTSSDGNNTTLVYYSLGNVLANMNFGTHQTNGYAEDAIIAKVKIERDSTGTVKVTTGEYIKTYILKIDSGGKRIHRIMPVSYALNNPDKYNLSEYLIGLIAASDKRIDNVLTSSGTSGGEIRIGEYK